MSVTSWCRDMIETAAEEYELDPRLVEAVVRTESSGNPRAYRYEPKFWDRYLKNNIAYNTKVPKRVSASYGLMQIMYPTACEMGFDGPPEMLFVPEISLDIGCNLLSINRDWAKGDMDAALAAYNGGRTNDNKRPPYRNGGYVIKVRGHLRDILKGF